MSKRFFGDSGFVRARSRLAFARKGARLSRVARLIVPLSVCVVMLWVVPAGAQSAEASAPSEPARVEVVSHAAERRAGWWILGVMGAAGVTSTTIGMLQTCGDDQTCQQWTSLAIWSGIALTAAGALIGLPKIVKSDEKLTVQPGAVSLADPAGARLPERTSASACLTGLTLSGHF